MKRGSPHLPRCFEKELYKHRHASLYLAIAVLGANGLGSMNTNAAYTVRFPGAYPWPHSRRRVSGYPEARV